MQPFPIPVLPTATRIRPRTALVASADRSFRQRLSEILTGLRWQVREAEGGAQAWAEAEAAAPEAVIVDSWLPDLDLAEFLKDFRGSFPLVDLVTASGSTAQESQRGPYRQELLYALRRCQDTDTVAWNAAPALNRPNPAPGNGHTAPWPIPFPDTAVEVPSLPEIVPAALQDTSLSHTKTVSIRSDQSATSSEPAPCERLPELIGNANSMLEISRRVRLVAPRSTPVLIEGPTGSGKEIVAEALHRLSTRSRKPFVAINCAAIPEALLEAELFGHTRGAFTGAVQGRIGRIESADGGTLFLDEIGEMPLALQSKLLRFVECGELQRVGDNETVKVDVRIVAATHQALAQQTQTGAFRSDLYYRLAVFLIRTPALADHAQDLPLLVDHFMQRMGREAPVKRVDHGALAKLAAHDWPGNVRELEHVLERGAILAGDEAVLTAREIDFGFTVN
ncbi:MAG: sigma-54 dependent transcriptional regulator [Terracidiphilus sp.]|nr:sigma-54 dependent transcriptional regulator [Terracidiphilus sp.]